MDNLHLQLQCIPAEKQKTDEQTSLCKRFLKHAQSLVLEWCACSEDVVIDLLISDNNGNESVRDIRFLSKGRFYGCKKKKLSDSAKDKEAIIEAVVMFLESCKNVRKIDFGTNAALCHNIDIMKVLKEKSDQGKLEKVNMSGIYPYWGKLFFIPEERTKRRLSLLKDSLFKTVSEITVNWDSHFKDLITTLSTTSSPVKTLGLTIQPEEFWDYVNPKNMTLTQLWKLLISNKPGIEVKLNLEELPYHKDEDLNDIRAVFNAEMPLTRLCVVYKMEEFAQIVLRNLKKEKHAPNLKEIGFHKIDMLRLNTVPVTEVNEVSKEITDLKCMKEIRKISWSGEFVLLTDLLSVVTQHVATLQELNIHKDEVVSEKIQAEEEDEKQAKKKRKKKFKDYDPLTDTEVLCVERTVSKMLRKSWSMLREVPVQMCPINKDLEFNYFEDLPGPEMFYVLQNKAV